MDIRDKLQLIQQLSGLTQTELALKLKVSFAAYNRWVNKKAKPRAESLKNINGLYKSLTGQKEEPESVFLAKKQIILAKQKKNKGVLGKILKNPDILESFLLALTYNSNSIEGSTLKEDETAAILFHNSSIPQKSVTEHLEAKNHQAVLHYLFRYVKDKKRTTQDFILKFHSILLNGIRDDAGQYRKHAVRIVGSYVPTANFIKIPALMNNLIKKINSTNKDIIAKLAKVHSEFEQIHPFSDGNGRVGRLLMCAELLGLDMPPAVIKQKNKRKYLKQLNKSQLKGEFKELEEVICDAILEGYKILERK